MRVGATVGTTLVVVRSFGQGQAPSLHGKRRCEKMKQMSAVTPKITKPIPLVDLKQQYLWIKKEIDTAIQEVITKADFTLGESVRAFEEEFAAFCDATYGIGVSSGTDALHLALLACGIKQGDEVITAPNSFIATAEAISMCGAKPVFVDIDEKSYNIDVTQIEEKITPRTKAIVPVHLYGHPTEMDTILEIARKYQLKVIEDACQAHGAMYKGKKVGSSGHAGCFSFYPSKNLGAFGDGGMVTTNKYSIAKKVRLLREHGQKDKYTHIVSGFCNRLHSIQAAVLRVKLKYLDFWNACRREKARAYREIFEEMPVTYPVTNNDAEHVYHLYVIRVKERDKLREKLAAKGIGTGIHYPIPIHLQPAFARLGYKSGNFPVTEKVAGEIVSLPMFPELQYREIEEIAYEVGKHASQYN